MSLSFGLPSVPTVASSTDLSFGSTGASDALSYDPTYGYSFGTPISGQGSTAAITPQNVSQYTSSLQGYQGAGAQANESNSQILLNAAKASVGLLGGLFNNSPNAQTTHSATPASMNMPTSGGGGIMGMSPVMLGVLAIGAVLALKVL